jgi:hypothetical protein
MTEVPVPRAFVFGAHFDRFESHTAVVAGLVPPRTNFKAQSKNNQGGHDKPGHDLRE